MFSDYINSHHVGHAMCSTEIGTINTVPSGGPESSTPLILIKDNPNCCEKLQDAQWLKQDRLFLLFSLFSR